jgi:hypothetical protein
VRAGRLSSLRARKRSLQCILYERVASFSLGQTLLALTQAHGDSGRRRRGSQQNAWCCVAEHAMGRRLVAMFFGPHAP